MAHRIWRSYLSPFGYSPSYHQTFPLVSSGRVSSSLPQNINVTKLLVWSFITNSWKYNCIVSAHFWTVPQFDWSVMIRFPKALKPSHQPDLESNFGRTSLRYFSISSIWAGVLGRISGELTAKSAVAKPKIW